MNFTDPCFENTVRALMETFKTAFVPETYREVALSRMLSGKAAPSPYREFTECELQDHAIQLAALEEHPILRRVVTMVGVRLTKMCSICER